MTANTSTVTPEGLFKVWSPDEVAECLDGVGDDLYRALWALVPLYQDEPRSEVPDDFARRALARFWDHLDRDTHLRLNELAVAHDRELGFGDNDEGDR